jgi:hypothetical protein
VFVFVKHPNNMTARRRFVEPLVKFFVQPSVKNIVKQPAQLLNVKQVVKIIA